MSCFKRFALGLLLAACAALYAQQPAARVSLHVVALDSAGRPVPDLAESDLKVFDNGARQKIVSFRLNQTDGPRALVILFDLMNSSLSSRGEIWNIVKNSLSRLPPANSLYLYLLAEEGSLYAVHGLADSADPSWVQKIAPLLDDAMRKTLQLKPHDLTRTSVIALPELFKRTGMALDDLRSRMATLHGPKDLLWITYGFPSAIRLAGTGWWDGGPLLRELGARFVQSDITIYTADPAMSLTRGALDRDALDILTGATGGHSFSNVDIGRAIAQIEAGARANYSLEFQPSAANWNGKYHKLRVTAARKGVHVETQQGYFAVLGS